jgi:selenium metabolism protein YedF
MSTSTVVVVSGETMGTGDDELGRLLLRSHLHVLTEMDPKPHALVFYNAGVRLAAEGSASLQDLRSLAEQGVRLLLCGTCVSFFGLEKEIAAGEVSNMYAISELLMEAAKVIRV